MKTLEKILKQPESTESLEDQFEELILIAERFGLTAVIDHLKQNRPKRYGCFVGMDHLNSNNIYPNCVLDEDNLEEDVHDCNYAKPGTRREDCPKWREIKK
jgi:hypothetical protein